MKILIIGAGPTGLGAAWRLQEKGHKDWLLLEASAVPGGLAQSITDEKGFTWDMGVHVLFSKSDYFNELMNKLLKDQWLYHKREAWIYMRNRFISYPLQNNINALPWKEYLKCLSGIIGSKVIPRQKPKNFDEWVVSHFGEGLADIFMRPYNKKVWGCDPKEMIYEWVGERVSKVKLFNHEKSWGPNATFRFPKKGGTGSIWSTVFNKLPIENKILNCGMISIDTAEKIVHTSDGNERFYDRLISTIPLDQFLHKSHGLPLSSTIPGLFKHTSTHIVGIGIEGGIPEFLKTKSWIYFPEDSVIFYRLSIHSNYSPDHVPNPKTQWSILCEVAESSKILNIKMIPDQVSKDLQKIGFLGNGKIVSLWHKRLEYGYPTPFLGRDALLNMIQPILKNIGIFSCGRFGAWKYEISNQDHSFMQGVEAADQCIS